MKVQAGWKTFVRFNDLLFNCCRKMHPFGLIHDMNCIETFFLEKIKPQKVNLTFQLSQTSSREMFTEQNSQPDKLAGVRAGKG